MEYEKHFFRRSNLLIAAYIVCLVFFVGILYDAQIVHGADYRSESTTQITTTQKVKTFRGKITDRNGKVLVSNRQVYTVSFDPDLVADEADENMKQAVALYHSAYEAEVFDEPMAQAAREYYDRANIRIQYIISILHGEIPEGEGITYTEENSILGGGYLNKDKEEEEQGEENLSGTDAGKDAQAGGDDFDTDDTVFYEEPESDTTQESTQGDE